MYIFQKKKGDRITDIKDIHILNDNYLLVGMKKINIKTQFEVESNSHVRIKFLTFS